MAVVELLQAPPFQEELVATCDYARRCIAAVDGTALEPPAKEEKYIWRETPLNIL